MILVKPQDIENFLQKGTPDEKRLAETIVTLAREVNLVSEPMPDRLILKLGDIVLPHEEGYSCPHGGGIYQVGNVYYCCECGQTIPKTLDI